MKGPEFSVHPPGEGPICDFCSDSRVWASYPAKDFAITPSPGPNVASRGNWAACKTCAQLVEAGEWDRLLDRSVSTFAKKYGPVVPVAVLRSFIAQLHAEFRVNRQPLQ